MQAIEARDAKRARALMRAHFDSRLKPRRETCTRWLPSPC
jgi:DNA-binding GntR family transcriptional regulator